MNGFDLLRVLLYNGLCIRVVVKGLVQIRTRGLFDCFLNLLEAKQAAIAQQQNTTDASDDKASHTTGVSKSTLAMDTSALFSEGLGNFGSSQVVKPENFITAVETRFSYHDLLSDTATIIDLEPVKDSFARAAVQRARK